MLLLDATIDALDSNPGFRFSDFQVSTLTFRGNELPSPPGLSRGCASFTIRTSAPRPLSGDRQIPPRHRDSAKHGQTNCHCLPSGYEKKNRQSCIFSLFFFFLFGQWNDLRDRFSRRGYSILIILYTCFEMSCQGLF